MPLTRAGKRCWKCPKGSMFWSVVTLESLDHDSDYVCQQCGATGTSPPRVADATVPLRDRVGVGKGGGRSKR